MPYGYAGVSTIMFTSPKRHTYHDFPPSLAKEYIQHLNSWDIPKRWNRRQVYYTEEHGVSVIHDAIRYGSDSVILEFCKILGDTKNSKRRLPLRLPTPLAYAIACKRNFELM